MKPFAVGAICALVGCAPRVHLVDERAVAPHARLVAEDLALDERRLSLDAGPRRSGRYSVHARFIRGRGQADAAPILVLVNGVFSDGETWRFLDAPLAADHDLLVLDLPGTGRSVLDDPDAEPSDAFTLAWSGARIFLALEDFARRSGRSRDLVLVGHSLAGTVVLQMLGDPALANAHGSILARVRGAALIAPADVGVAAWDPTFVTLAKLSEIEVTLGATFGVLRERVEEAIHDSVDHPAERAFRREADRILESLEDRSRRRASQLMLRRIRPVDDDDVPEWPKVERLVANQRRIERPVLLLWGRHDRAIPLSTARRLAREVPTSRLVIVEDARHSLHQEKPLETAALLARFAVEVAAHD